MMRNFKVTDGPDAAGGSRPRQGERLATLRATRDNTSVSNRLDELRDAARDDSAPLMPRLLDCVRARVTEGEIMAALAGEFGTYLERSWF